MRYLSLHTFKVRVAVGVLMIVLAVTCFYMFAFKAPAQFPSSVVVKIPNGTSLTEIARNLERDHIISSPFWFNNFVIFFKRERRVVGGEYYFERPLNVYQIAKRLTHGSYNIEQLKTTIPEGSSVKEIVAILQKRYPDFDTENFIKLAQIHEGYLFPDTYKLGADPQPEKIVEVLTSTFDKKINQQEIKDAITASGKSIKDVVIMASILEGEARQMRTRQIVAGILWERINQGIPLQVDAAFKYVNGKTTANLTLSDLKIDSPYNTYVYKGLPPTPISNPGLDSIMAAVTPIQTDYLYFLTDKDGNMHYAKTLEEHVSNKKKYLSY